MTNFSHTQPYKTMNTINKFRFVSQDTNQEVKISLAKFHCKQTKQKDCPENFGKDFGIISNIFWLSVSSTTLLTFAVLRISNPTESVY